MPGQSHTYDLFIRGRAAAKSGEKAEARRYLERVLSLYPPEEERMEALYWLAEVSDDPKEQRGYLEEILANNLGDARARRKMAILDGRLKVEEIVDPDRMPAASGASAAEGSKGGARSFTCPKCGARMVYAPDGMTLTCEYCQAREQIQSRPSGGEADDFIVAMATAKAQRKPVQTRAIACRGCGSNFLLPPHIITQTCPYCATPYALEQVEVRQLDAPDGILPFTIDEKRAKQALRDWFLRSKPEQPPKVARGLGVYLPAWLFDVGGQINWTGQIYKEKRTIPVSGARVVGEYGLLVPATKRLGPDLRPAFWQFDLSVIQPFDLRFLADWMAETFTITAADAALEVRQQAQEKLKRQIQTEEIDQAVQNFNMRTANMLVESYRLVLLPVWLASYTLGDDPRRFELLINGQTAEVLGQKPDRGLTGWVKSLLS
jgi:hypothetical protein